MPYNSYYLAFSTILFAIGVLGILLNSKNIITIFLSIELLLLAVNINLVAASSYWHDLSGQILSMFVLTVAGAEAAIGLAILVVYYRSRGSIQTDDATLLKG